MTDNTCRIPLVVVSKESDRYRRMRPGLTSEPLGGEHRISAALTAGAVFSRPSAKSAVSLDTLRHALGIGRMTARLQLRLVDNSELEIPLETARAEDVIAATPWRTFRSHRNQRHYSGWYWSSTTGDHVIYESRLELARLLLADADRDVVAIAAQPFLLIEGAETKPRRHVPDFFLQRRDGSCAVVNVKPADRVDDPKVAATLAWAGEAITAKGWAAEVWTG
ncbi:MAG: TnsA-like heteromeric transposase endonuclease subunit, partial [Actinobacteria bacterium]|nr:TnsA-like heteromeric transposase endonuclease subunit [Actinomycetota bacterium]